MFKQQQHQVYITSLYRVQSLTLHVDIVTFPPRYRIWRRGRQVLVLVLIENCALRSQRSGCRQLHRLLLRLVALLMRYHLLLLRGDACTLKAAPLLQLLLRRKSLDLALLKMALVLRRLCGWGSRQLLGPWGLRVLKSNSRDFSEFSGGKLLLYSFQAWILSLL